MTNIFGKLLSNLVDGDTYNSLPPKGPIELEDIPSVSDRELNSLDQDEFGQDEREPIDIDNQNTEGRIKVVEDSRIKEITLPDESLLSNLNIIGISGSNNRILTTSFHLILSRVAIVNFRYTSGYEKPYFYTKFRDVSSILVMDNNIFDASYSIHTYNDIVEKEDAPILDQLSKNKNNLPFRFKYNHERSKKAPSSQSLGLAVKFQHTLELSGIKDIQFGQSGLTVCIKDGAMFSNSTTLSDIGNGLKELLAWAGKDRFFIAVSTKVSESRVLLNTLLTYPHLIEDYFPKQHITERVIRSFGTDSLLLKKILKPGYRTPWIEYIERTREGAINSEELKGLKPITCYYHKRSKPYNFIRLEMPKFMWEGNKSLADSALAVAIWQYELGGNQPLILKAATERCDLNHDKWVIEQQMKAAFEKKKLDLVEFIDMN